MSEPRVRGVIADKGTPVSAIMAALFGTDPNDPEILAVEAMSDEEIAPDAAEIRAQMRREGDYLVGPEVSDHSPPEQRKTRPQP